MTAAGPTPIVGATGSAAVTDAPVSAGTYALSETGPAGYARVGVGRVWAGRRRVRRWRWRSGESATCTITNDDIPAQLTLVKTVTNDNGGTAVADGLDIDRGRADADRRGRPGAPR